jgi:hypothetical protein
MKGKSFEKSKNINQVTVERYSIHHSGECYDNIKLLRYRDTSVLIRKEKDYLLVYDSKRKFICKAKKINFHDASNLVKERNHVYI